MNAKTALFLSRPRGLVVMSVVVLSGRLPSLLLWPHIDGAALYAIATAALPLLVFLGLFAHSYWRAVSPVQHATARLILGIAAPAAFLVTDWALCVPFDPFGYVLGTIAVLVLYVMACAGTYAAVEAMRSQAPRA